MEFRTPTPPLTGRAGLLRHGSPIWTIGSCFADNVGERLRADLFEARVNPFGPLFNPLSIASALEMVAAGTHVTPDEFFLRDGAAWVSHRFHSRLSGPTAAEGADRANRLIDTMRAELPGLVCLMVTLGSAVVFELADSGTPVANCHKRHPSLFTTRDIPAEECAAALGRAIAALRRVNPSLPVVVTVSPVRHTAYGQRRDKLSKAALLLATAELERAAGAVYFPSYEIVMDDLRDYRFYAPDMKHPTPQAADYVYEIMARSFFTPETAAAAREGRRLSAMAAHRPAPGAETEHAGRVRALAAGTASRYPAMTTAITRLLNDTATDTV